MRQELLPTIENSMLSKINENSSKLRNFEQSILEFHKQIQLSKETDELRYKIFLEETYKNEQTQIKLQFKPMFENIQQMIMTNNL